MDGANGKANGGAAKRNGVSSTAEDAEKKIKLAKPISKLATACC